MTNNVSARSQALVPAPTNVNVDAGNAGGGLAVAGQPLISGDPKRTDAALGTQVQGGGGGATSPDSIADAAMAKILGPTVTGGGAPGVGDPKGGIPDFVRQFLSNDKDAVPPAGTLDAADGATEQNEAPSKKSAPAGRGTEPQRAAQRGWAWVGCSPGQGPQQGTPNQGLPPQGLPPQPPVDEQGPPMKGSDPYGPPMKGEATDCAPTPPDCTPDAPEGPTGPPTKGEEPTPPPPPTKGEEPLPPPPPGKGDVPSEPPSKGEKPTPPAPHGKTDEVCAPGEAKDKQGTYTVKKGDNLSKIAEGYGISWRQLYWANKDQIKNPDLIYPGQKFDVPCDELEVPDFPYTPSYGPSTPPAKHQPTPPSKHGPTPPSKHGPTPPAKGDHPPSKSPPSKAPTPPSKTPPTPGTTPATPAPPKDSKTPPTKPPTPGVPAQGTPGKNPGGQLPPAPPVPSGTGLPPALPST
ncbi:MAG: LysM domain protein [Thermoleophilia bacterium]|nr:LysM domain protein [Thermoleophilia bacterium]